MTVKNTRPGLPVLAMRVEVETVEPRTVHWAERSTASTAAAHLLQMARGLLQSSR